MGFQMFHDGGRIYTYLTGGLLPHVPPTQPQRGNTNIEHRKQGMQTSARIIFPHDPIDP